jgi:hypothetical protein
LCNYVEIVLWFATAYALLYRCEYLSVSFKPVAPVILRESVGLMVANSSGVFKNPEGWVIWITMTLHCVVGLFMTTIVAARLIALLPRLSTLDPDEGEAGEDWPT